MFFHLFQVVLHNAFILHRKFSTHSISHDTFLEHMAQYLIAEGVTQAMCQVQRVRNSMLPSTSRFAEQHFLSPITPGPRFRGKSKKCFACTFGKRFLQHNGYPHRKPEFRKTSYKCEQCSVPLCITPCFKMFHQHGDYREKLLGLLL